MDSQRHEALLRKLRATWPPMSQAQLGLQIGIAETRLSRILNGSRPAPADFYVNVADVLGCAVSEIEPEREVAA